MLLGKEILCFANFSLFLWRSKDDDGVGWNDKKKRLLWTARGVPVGIRKRKIRRISRRERKCIRRVKIKATDTGRSERKNTYTSKRNMKKVEAGKKEIV